MENPENGKIENETCNNEKKIKIEKISLTDAPCGIDIGGTLTKIVYWRPHNPPALPNFVTQEMVPDLPLKADPSLQIDCSQGVEGILKFLKFPSCKTTEFMQWALENELTDSWGSGKAQVVNATGGGSVKYAKQVKDVLGVKFAKKDELQSAIKGLNFLIEHAPDELFSYAHDEKTKKIVSFDSEGGDFIPYLLVNIGSGVSIMKCTSTDHYERVSGTSLGGGTFWGLCRLLTNLQSFDEIKDLHGDNKTVDLLVGDIYGKDYAKHGLPSTIIASSFGKIGANYLEEEAKVLPIEQLKKEDVVKSLLYMFVNNIGQIAYLNAKLHNTKNVFFSGQFIQENPYVWEKLSYGINFWSGGEMKAIFIKHDGYLGAMGAMLS